MGRFLGKALFDGIKVPNTIAPYIYKLMSGCPITKNDVQKHCDLFSQMDRVGDVATLCMNFTIKEMVPFEGWKSIELIHNGHNISVTNNNLSMYKQALLKYLVFGRVKAQMSELLRGIHEVVPKNFLSVFYFNELQVLCGYNEKL